jgi:replicative DNA helicase
MEIERKVEIQPDTESMQKISLFESMDERAKRIRLGFNEDFDEISEFLSTDYIMVGGRRGAGKSILCNNVTRNVTKQGKDALYFSIEMMPREVLQRDVAIATQIPFSKIRNKELSQIEWEQLATYWASRYENGAEHLAVYLKEHRDFDRFHKTLCKELLTGPQVDIIYDPVLNLGRIRSEIDKRIALGKKIGIVAVDYINKVRKTATSTDNFDWKQQIDISTELKSMAQIYGIPFFSPYQVDATGEARFAKGILDAADAAFVMTPHDNCVTFDVTKMRAATDDATFTSEMNWSTVTVGPRSVDPPQKEETNDKLKGRKKGDKIVNPDVYDESPF